MGDVFSVLHEANVSGFFVSSGVSLFVDCFSIFKITLLFHQRNENMAEH